MSGDYTLDERFCGVMHAFVGPTDSAAGLYVQGTDRFHKCVVSVILHRLALAA